MTLAFTDAGWESYLSWNGDRRAPKRIHSLIADVQRNGHGGIGHPEQLSGDLAGWWSRRVDEKNRLVYRISADGTIEVAQCRGHYRDR
ncbi:MAG: Txe/YoeB family addiction module toxin [Bifidobacteriaceae bacterium]|nr:Txe/YoeB family addiction module toxin [Bifidobacteriaceae bacterium]